MGKTLIFTFVSILYFAPHPAMAFGASEQEQMKEDVREALHRARDFNAQKVREATESVARERGAREVKKKRADFEADQEATRIGYVRDRNAQPSDFLQQARLERQFEEQKIIEDRGMEKSRRRYSRDRRKVERIINSNAYINEAQEFGL